MAFGFKCKRLMAPVIVLVILLYSVAAYAENANTNMEDFDLNSVESALLINVTGMQCALEYNSNSPHLAAGLSRLPAMLVLSEAIDSGELSMTETVTVSRAAAGVPGPTAFVDANETIALQDLYKAAVMISAGDAVYALAEKLCGTIDAFMNRMNLRMQELGVANQTESIMNGEGELSANDLAKIGAALSKSKSFTSYCCLFMDGITHNNKEYTELVSGNKLLKQYPGCTGMATGSSTSAGYGGVFLVERNDTKLICVILGAKNSSARFVLATSMLEYGYANFKAVSLLTEGDIVSEGVRVTGGRQGFVNLISNEGVALLLPKNAKDPIQTLNVPELMAAPIKKDVPAGTLEYKDTEGNLLAKVDLFPQQDIEIAKFGDYLRLILLNWIHV